VKPYDFPDAKGHFGPYGGVFVAETLMHALDELRASYDRYRVDPAFLEEFNYELKHFVGRPSPVYHARRWSELVGGAQIWFKREDLNHTGAPPALGLPAGQRDWPMRRRKVSHAASWSRATYSSGLWACSMWPGPQTTVGMPMPWKSPASVP